jgi:hypothetical protein
MVASIAATVVDEDGVDPASCPDHCRSQEIFRSTGAEAFRRKSPAPYQTTLNVDSLETHVHSLEHLTDNVVGLDKAVAPMFHHGNKDGWSQQDKEPGTL